MSSSKNKDNLPLPRSSVYEKKLKSRRRIVESFEAKANTNRSTSEKIADTLTARLGSMLFLGINASWFFIWIVVNTGLVPSVKPFDPFPFGLLTMIVSLEAIFLAIIVLISQNRAAKIDDLREEFDLQINTIAEEEVTKIIQLQVMLLKKNGIDISKDEDLKQMLEPTDTQKIEKSLEKQVT
ncbi:MAG TPA: DUF1003 domain-containing protein [Candidatus Limnocylindrales bacterium]|nr:DUF1003 domain-containing protein [Candidatus Limnocylindrales bacterium]